MTEQQIDFVRQCIKTNIHKFYTWQQWLKVRRQVLENDRHECQRCRKKKKYAKATTVHHINHVRDRPDLALEMWYEWQGEKKRNLISLCHDCHEEAHGYRKTKTTEPLTTERW